MAKKNQKKKKKKNNKKNTKYTKKKTHTHTHTHTQNALNIAAILNLGGHLENDRILGGPRSFLDVDDVVNI